MAAMTVGGLASGLDTNSIISQLTALEQAKVTREEKKKAAAEETLDKFKELETMLSGLQAKANGLHLPENFNVFKSTSNNEDYATISGGEGATAGHYEMVVHQLATTQKVASSSFEKIADPLELSGKILLSTSAATQKTDPKKTTVEVEIQASDSLKDVVNKINAAEGSGVKASLMTLANGENRIVLTAVDTGTQSFHISNDSGNAKDILGSNGLGFLNDSAVDIATSGKALITKEGIADGSTELKDLDVAFGSIDKTDQIGIKINGNWYATNVFDNVSAPQKYKTMDEVLGELNSKISAFNISLDINKSGEIVINGSTSGMDLKEISLQIGANLDGSGSGDTKSKINLGTFTQTNTFSNIVNEAQNAFYTVDGIAISSQSNNDDKTIVGSTFNLKKADKDVVVNVSMELDTSAIVDRIAEFIEEFNSLLKFIDENARAVVVEQKDAVTGKTQNIRTVGPFTGDSNISGLRDNLKRMVTGTINELTGIGNYANLGFKTDYSSAARIGVLTEKDGSISLDKEKLSKAVAADFEGIRRLFSANGFSNDPGYKVGHFMKDSKAGTYEIFDYGTRVLYNGEDISSSCTITANILTTKEGLSIEMPEIGSGNPNAKVTFVRGIADQLSNFVEKAKGSVDGYFKKSKETYQKRIEEIQKRVNELQVRVDRFNARITSQFASLEKSMSNLQSQSANMISALSNLNNNSK